MLLFILHAEGNAFDTLGLSLHNRLPRLLNPQLNTQGWNENENVTLQKLFAYYISVCF